LEIEVWIQHPRVGHLSVVLARRLDEPGQPPDPNKVMVRARKREHLENLKGAVAALRRAEVLEDTLADYRFRIVIPKEDFAVVMQVLATRLDWSNVKAEAAANQSAVGRDFVSALHEVWRIFYDLQPRSKGDFE